MKLLESRKPCPVCGGPTLTPEDDEYIRCIYCKVVRTCHHYSASLYRKEYADTYLGYASNETLNTPLNLLRLGLVSRWLRPHRCLLDIGCCIGEFIRFAEPYYPCMGFEPNEIAATLAKGRVHSPIVTTLGGVMLFDCITMFDVLEHIESPIENLRPLLGASLRQDGVLIITTPNVSVVPLWEDSTLRSWKHWKPKEHLWLHTEVSLRKIAEILGLRVLYVGREESDIRPGNEDGGIITAVFRKES